MWGEHMAKPVKCAVHDLNPYNHNCPNCGNPMIEVPYFTAVPATGGKYSGLTKRNGGYCLKCEIQNKRKRLPLLIAVVVISIAVLVIGLLMGAGVIAGRDAMDGNLDEFVIVAGGAMLVVAAAFLPEILLTKTDKPIPYMKAYYRFLTALAKQKERDLKLSYFNTDEGGRLTHLM